jgi:hypothetical protein
MLQKNKDAQLQYRFSHSEMPSNDRNIVPRAPLPTESDDFSVALGSPEGIPQILKQFDARAHLL